MMNGLDSDVLCNELNRGKDIYNDFVKSHSHQLETSDVPKHFWPCVAHKLENQIYDAGEYFQMLQSVGDEESEKVNWQVVVCHPGGLNATDSNNIFLIDHAWTYQQKEAKSSLEECEGLLERMCCLMDIQMEKVGREVLIDQVLEEMWKFNGTYSLGLGSVSSTSNVRMWYVMDEFGSRIQHDGDPTFRVVPLFYVPHQCCYSLLFPVKDTDDGDEVTRNYVESPPVDELTRDAQMLPWFPVDMSSLDLKFEEPSVEFFQSGRLAENLPETPMLTAAPLPSDRRVKVYSDYKYIREYLTDNRFEIVTEEKDADIIWISTHFTDFRSLAETPTKRINQFPYENVIVVKNLLAIAIGRIAGDQAPLSPDGCWSPRWMIPTFCLKRELPHFVSFFQKREKLGLDNSWIIKPWNLARGLDQTVTNNLNHIVRLPSTGPKIAQKYLHNPVLFYRDDIGAKVKFDLRFIVLLLSVEPLKVAVYKNFWIRFANKSFDLEDFEDYDKHFTVNNYNDSFLLQMFCHDFIEKFEAQNPSYSWREVQNKIYMMVKELFVAATRLDPPKGIPHNAQSKGSYGIDLMINWEINDSGSEVMQPKLLEVNFNSDCKRACEYYPNFFNDLFKLMFLEKIDCDTIEILE